MKAYVSVIGTHSIFELAKTVSRRAFVRSGLVATPATAVSPLAHSATRDETQSAPETSDTALLILDFQVGIGDQPYAKSAVQRAAAALKAGRAAGLPVVFQQRELPCGIPRRCGQQQSICTHQDEEPVPAR